MSGVVATEAAIAGAKHSADAAGDLCHHRQHWMIAGPSVVARIGSRQRALLLSEERLDRGVDVEMHGFELLLARFLEAVARHQHLELGERHVVEAAQVAVHRVDARHRPSRQAYEERIGGQRFQPEHARLADDIGIEQQSQLGLHRIDDAATHLELVEHLPQLGVDAQPPQIPAERRQPCDAGQRRIARAESNALRIRSPNAPASALQIVAQCTLATERSSAHLMDARRIRRCHVLQQLRRVRRALDSCRIRTLMPAGCRRRSIKRREIQVQSKIVSTTSATNPVVDAANIYWIDSSFSEILKAPKGGGPSSVVAGSQKWPFDLALDDGFVYWTTEGKVVGDPTQAVVMRAPKSGGPPQLVTTAFNDDAYHLVVSGSDVFYTGYVAGPGETVWRAPKAGGASTLLLYGPGEGQSADLVTDGTDLFANPQGWVSRYSKTGTNLGSFPTLSPHTYVSSMAVDTTHLCVVEREIIVTCACWGSTALVCHEKSNGGRTILSVVDTGPNDPYDPVASESRIQYLQTDGTFLYFVRDDNLADMHFNIERAHKCGGAPVRLQTLPFSGLPLVTGLTVDDHFVYWTTTDGIYRAAK